MIHWTDIAGQLAQSGAFKAIDNSIFKRAFPIISADNRGFIGLDIGGNSEHPAHTKTCTLIARSVDDMTEEEKQKRQELMDLITVFDVATNEWHVVDGDDSVKSFLYLISIGVLPPNVSTEGVEFITTNGE